MQQLQSQLGLDLTKASRILDAMIDQGSFEEFLTIPAMQEFN